VRVVLFGVTSPSLTERAVAGRGRLLIMKKIASKGRKEGKSSGSSQIPILDAMPNKARPCL
jgi:hypothetical protein